MTENMENATATTKMSKEEAIKEALRMDGEKSLDRELEAQTKDLFKKGFEQAGQKEQAEKQQVVMAEYEKMRNMGFTTAKEVAESLKAKEEQLTKAFEEINQIKAYLKNVQAPARNSGELDSPARTPPNPLIPRWVKL